MCLSGAMLTVSYMCVCVCVCECVCMAVCRGVPCSWRHASAVILIPHNTLARRWYHHKQRRPPSSKQANNARRRCSRHRYASRIVIRPALSNVTDASRMAADMVAILDFHHVPSAHGGAACFLCHRGPCYHWSQRQVTVRAGKRSYNLGM